MAKKSVRSYVRNKILHEEFVREIAENVISLATEIVAIKEILDKYQIPDSQLLKRRLERIKILCIVHDEDFLNVVERFILDEGLITKEKVPSKRSIEKWFEKVDSD